MCYALTAATTKRQSEIEIGFDFFLASKARSKHSACAPSFPYPASWCHEGSAGQDSFLPSIFLFLRHSNFFTCARQPSIFAPSPLLHANPIVHASFWLHTSPLRVPLHSRAARDIAESPPSRLIDERSLLPLISSQLPSPSSSPSSSTALAARSSDSLFFPSHVRGRRQDERKLQIWRPSSSLAPPVSLPRLRRKFRPSPTGFRHAIFLGSCERRWRCCRAGFLCRLTTIVAFVAKAVVRPNSPRRQLHTVCRRAPIYIGDYCSSGGATVPMIFQQSSGDAQNVADISSLASNVSVITVDSATVPMEFSGGLRDPCH